MSRITAVSPSSLSPEPEYQPYRWTREEYERAVSAGVFAPQSRHELLEGEIIIQMPENPPHVLAMKLVEIALARAFSLIACHLHPQHPIALSSGSEPEPDVAVIIGSPRDYQERHPEPNEILLLVEISDSTLGYDRNRKAAAYAAAGISEYWIVNLIDRQVEVFRTPIGSEYQDVRSYTASEAIAPLAAPQTLLVIADLLP